jgi:copper(I)-binding protein
VSRSILVRRAAVAALAGAAALLATACSAGQTAQTANERSTVDGASANAGSIALRNVRVTYPPTNAKYTAGSSASLEFSAVNTGLTDDKLVSVTAPVAASVVLGPGLASSVTATGSSSSASSSSSAPASSSATSSSAPSSGGGQQQQVDLPPGTAVTFGADGAVVQLKGLSTDLISGQTVQVTFTFARSGSVTVPVPVATSLNQVFKGSPVPTGSGEGGG